MIYAPIVIPTLNRIEHLKRCITSLQANSWAKYSPLIISVDYPPAQKYEEGYRYVCEYLQDGITGFASVDIIYQEENLGAYENAEFLKSYSEKSYDRYIFMEDDIEVSPNYIEYIDKGLELFENDNSILAVCSTGAENEEETIENNVVITHNYSAHGYGTWINKENMIMNAITRKYFEEIAGHIKNLWELYQYDPSLLFALQSAIYRKEKLYQLSDGSIPIIDMTVKIYAVLENKYVVCPCRKKSRNWGYDGSGENCPQDDRRDPKKINIDQRHYFDYQYSYPLKLSKLHEKYSLEIIIRSMAAFIKLWLFKAS